MSLVFFDFDKTLIRIDTTLPFASFLASREKKRGKYFVLLGIYLLSRFRLISNQGLKKWYAQLFLLNETVDNVTGLARTFFEDYLAFIENREVVDRLRQYAARGDDVYLVSANFDFFIEPLQDKWPVTGIIATRPEIQQGRFTGKLLENSCHGSEKLERVVSFFGREKVKDAIAYGDNRADLCLLEFTKKGYWVQPVRNLSKTSIFFEKVFLFILGDKCLRVKDNIQCKTRILPVGKNDDHYISVENSI
jgi:HAD superfamily hydrolase (TIGR01490 family)